MADDVDHDRLFKELLQTFFIDFLDLFLPAVAAYLDPATIEFLDKELLSDLSTGRSGEVDLLVKARFRRETTRSAPGDTTPPPSADGPAYFLVHVENQSSAEPDFAERMFRYFAQLTLRHRLAVYPIALLTYETPRRPEPDRYTLTFPDRVVLDFGFHAIQLNRLDWREFARRPNPVAAALMAKMRIDPPDRPKVTVEILRLLATLKLDPARQLLIKHFMLTYLRLNAAERQEYSRELKTLTPPQQEAVMQVVDMWEEMGIAKGEARGEIRGEARGEVKGTISVLTAQLRRRFGPAADPLVDRLATLAPAKLQELATAILDFQLPADAEAWLAANTAMPM